MWASSWSSSARTASRRAWASSVLMCSTSLTLSGSAGSTVAGSSRGLTPLWSPPWPTSIPVGRVVEVVVVEVDGGGRSSPRARTGVPDPSSAAATTTTTAIGRREGIPQQIDHGG